MWFNFVEASHGTGNWGQWIISKLFLSNILDKYLLEINSLFKLIFYQTSSFFFY